MSSSAGGRPTSIAQVIRIHDHAADTRSLLLEPARSSRLRFVPGQFISISITLPDETRTRPYSIASSPDDDGPFEICFNRVAGGRGVAWLFDRKAGDQLAYTGPFGAFTLDRAPARETVFIAEGTAIAPIRPMLRRASASARHPKLTLLYGAADQAHILYRDEFDRLAGGGRAFTFDKLLAPAAELYDRLHAEVERRWVGADTMRDREFYVCGVGKGVLRIRDLLRSSGYERRAVHYEQW
ncbi:MAG: ferredoxin--NADP reductase [Candidatus Binataceae bacterium]